ncbi:SAM-dependent methyltransferase [Rhodothalassium salexigens]|uniref:class I SAM-dependent methyltransferase n=1 Tax=Rhodothalassium salexigens TaxID=1086 RepID=UPI001912E037|nr:class I SAM-dependent methyltransferase [Rhodothalassium salexigens]MBK5919551.1 SAM-dependent methyltransferase [Rhodothalassium salexigens]
MGEDLSNGWNAVADAFAARRAAHPIGRSVVRDWAASLPAGGSIVYVGAGSGEPLAAALVADGFGLWAIDAAPAMVAAFRRHLPDVPVRCEAAERSDFFGRSFDGALAVGLVFLLPADTQRVLIPALARALKPGGRLLFSAPAPSCVWDDLMTGRRSRSLGAAAYGRLLAEAGLDLVATPVDEGGNHYFAARKGWGRAGCRLGAAAGV